MSNLQTRIITAIVLGAAALWLTWIGGLGFTLFSIAIGLAMFHEWTSLTAPKQTLFLEHSVGDGWFYEYSARYGPLCVADHRRSDSGHAYTFAHPMAGRARLASGRTILCGFLRRFAFAPARRRTFRLYCHCFSFRCGLVHRYRSLLQRPGTGWAEAGAALLAEQDVVRRDRCALPRWPVASWLPLWWRPQAAGLYRCSRSCCPSYRRSATSRNHG